MLRVLLRSFEAQDTGPLSGIQAITSFKKLEEYSARAQIMRRDVQQSK